jgi:hypothetical protein
MGSFFGRVLVVFVLVMMANAAAGTPVFSAGTGSYYDVVDAKMTWTTAEASASSMFYQGIQGRLATITSAAENDFIEQNVLIGKVGPGNSYWLGGFQPAGSAEPAGGFQWITGEAFAYSNWDPGEPSNSNRNGEFENRIEMYAQESGTWNDLADIDAGLSEGYVVEFASATSVPEPAYVMLLVIGVGMLTRRRRCV